jgi:uncharacterized protein DUF3667
MGSGPGSAVCHNCGESLSGRFCAACGQKAGPLNPTFRDLVHDFTHELLHVDGRIFQSVKKLLLSPGFLTLELFKGRRARWISPLRLYLVFSLLYFAASASSTENMRVTVGGGSSAENADDLARLGFKSEQELQETAQRALHTWVPRVMFVLVPFSAWLVLVVYRRSGRNYPQHLFFALHVHAALFAAGAVLAAARLTGNVVAARLVGLLAILYAVVYVVTAFKNVYGGSLRRAVMRAAIVAGIYWVAIVGATLAILLPAVLGRQ